MDAHAAEVSPLSESSTSAAGERAMAVPSALTMTAMGMLAVYLPKFNGYNVILREWSERIQSAVLAYKVPIELQMEVATTALEGDARRTVINANLRAPVPLEDIILVLEEVYGDPSDTHVLRKRFLERNQKENETLPQYANALKELMGALHKREEVDGVNNPADDTTWLRDQFVLGIKSNFVRQALKQRLETKPDLDFLKLQNLAIKYGQEEEPFQMSFLHREMAGSSNTYLPKEDTSEQTEKELKELRVSIQEIKEELVHLKNNCLGLGPSQKCRQTPEEREEIKEIVKTMSEEVSVLKQQLSLSRSISPNDITIDRYPVRKCRTAEDIQQAHVNHLGTFVGCQMAKPLKQVRRRWKKNLWKMEKNILASKVLGTVSWFNMKRGYGFITRKDTKEDLFVHWTAIKKNNPWKILFSVRSGAIVQFDVVEGRKGKQAANVTGPGGTKIQCSGYATVCKQFQSYGSRSNCSHGGMSNDQQEEEHQSSWRCPSVPYHCRASTIRHPPIKVATLREEPRSFDISEKEELRCSISSTLEQDSRLKHVQGSLPPKLYSTFFDSKRSMKDGNNEQEGNYLDSCRKNKPVVNQYSTQMADPKQLSEKTEDGLIQWKMEPSRRKELESYWQLMPQPQRIKRYKRTLHSPEILQLTSVKEAQDKEFGNSEKE